jgi:hypothetical protein
MRIEAVAEMRVPVEKAGLKNEVMHDAINTIWPGAAGVYWKQIMYGQYYKENVRNPQLAPDCSADLNSQ